MMVRDLRGRNDHSTEFDSLKERQAFAAAIFFRLRKPEKEGLSRFYADFSYVVGSIDRVLTF